MSFEKTDVFEKYVFFLKDVFFLERRPIKPSFVNFEKHAGRDARDPNEWKTDEFYSADEVFQRTSFEKSRLFLLSPPFLKRRFTSYLPLFNQIVFI